MFDEIGLLVLEGDAGRAGGKVAELSRGPRTLNPAPRVPRLGRHAVLARSRQIRADSKTT